MKSYLRLLRETSSEWSADQAPRLGAAIAYYTIFSLAPLLIVVIAVAGLAFEPEAVQGEVFRQLEGLLGQGGAQMIQQMIAGAKQEQSGGIVATIAGFIVLLFGATGVMNQLQGALDEIWGVKPARSRPWWEAIRDRGVALAMVLGIGFLLLVSLIISAIVSVGLHFVGALFPVNALLVQAVNFSVALLVTALLFAMIFKYLPDVEIAWKNVWIGALLTAVLFTIGRYLIGLYLGNTAVGSVYGAAGSLVIVLLWTYYSSQILLFGAEFTQVYARASGAPIKPDEHFLIDEAKAAVKAERAKTYNTTGAKMQDRPAITSTRKTETEQNESRKDDQDSTSAFDLQSELQFTKVAITNTITRIKQNALRSTDPKEWIVRYPLTSVAVCAAAGLGAAALLSPGREGKPTRRVRQELRDRRAGEPRRLRAAARRSFGALAALAMPTIIESVKGAVSSFVSTAASGRAETAHYYPDRESAREGETGSSPYQGPF